MSLKLRYIVLISAILVLALVFIGEPKYTGRILDPGYKEVQVCSDATDYYSCIKCCEKSATGLHGKEYYGTEAWNTDYDSCWKQNCKKFSERDISQVSLT